MEMLFSKLCLALILFISYVKTQIPLKCSNEEKCLIKFEDYLSNNVGRIIYQENIQKDYEREDMDLFMRKINLYIYMISIKLLTLTSIARKNFERNLYLTFGSKLHNFLMKLMKVSNIIILLR